MKKLFFIILLFFIVIPQQAVLADEGSMSATVSPTVEAITTQYTLPYPGILPDNPLYIFKTLRDNIVVFFISDPLKKSSFFLLQSDKRLEASWYLLKENPAKADLALTTLSKSTNYFSQAVSQAAVAKKSGEDTTALKDTLKNAMMQHITTLQQILQLPGLSNKKGFAAEYVRLQDLGKVVSALSAH